MPLGFHVLCSRVISSVGWEVSTGVRVPAYIVLFVINGFRQLPQLIVRRDVLHVRHICGDGDLVFCPRTRTVFLVTTFVLPLDFGCVFLTAECLRQHVENNVAFQCAFLDRRMSSNRAGSVRRGRKVPGCAGCASRHSCAACL